ncbi:BadF/BadG/BcrA/BcrD ATPase family protein [Lentibacillus salicampi]|uniref:ATPase BadF/BadG/BcrA/BcrD type domain-containing protein n=1 Tax=Lentibacillus salicampi TaxID=175306 RepID=A0A4Y9AEG9_9BACI|nr:BadF/BadG/BcrA/BcrD ATPase family protein [Lentibacillus salicampi]TFJ94279.1 hypothetical protein E4U82_03210 [Lentibacillus salicampi]
MDYVMGIDGGGTKTKAVIADMSGSIIATSAAGPTNPNTVSKDQLKQTLESLFLSLEVTSDVSLKHVKSLFAGISGAGNETNRNDLKELMEPFMPGNTSIQIEADPVNALYSGTYGSPGVVQISGTGSITYGINRHLKHDRIGGWGYLFGDEGSGYDIGRQAIISALKSVDGRGPETMMLSMIYTHFAVSDAQSLIRKIYAASIPKNAISPIAEIVFEAYQQQDNQANAILQQAAKEMAVSIESLYEKLFEPGEQINVVLCGGVFSEKDVLPAFIRQELTHYPALNVTVPELSPVGGSIIGAYLIENKAVDNSVINNIIKTI